MEDLSVILILARRVKMVHIRIEPDFDSDIVIVGAGPAGATAAFHIARSGLKVILIDKQTFPRDKVCGDFVSPVALLELKKLGITDLPEYRKTNVINQASLYLDGKKLISRSIPNFEGLPPFGRTIPRLMLDKWIFDSACKAGAHVLEGFRVTKFQMLSDGIKLLIEGADGVRILRTKLVIGADGSNSTVSRFLRGNPPHSDDLIIGVRAYFEGVEGQPDQAELYFTSDSFPGYCWLFPISESRANVGVGMVLNTIPRTSNQLRELLTRLITEDTALSSRLSNATMVGRIGSWPLTTYNPRLPIVGDRIMLTGDAAGLINPLNGEGIQYALLSGRWASDVVISCFQRNDFSKESLSAYSDRVETELRYDLALSGMIVQLIRNRSLNPIWLQALQIITARARIDPDYANITGGILAGLIPSSDAANLKIITSTLEQAALSMGLKTVMNIVRGPKHLTKVSLETAEMGFEIAYDGMRHPVDFLKWGFGSATSIAEFANQISKHAIESSKKRPAVVNFVID